MAQLMPLPLTVSCFSKIQVGFTFLVPADLGSPGKRAVKRVCVYGADGDIYYEACKDITYGSELLVWHAGDSSVQAVPAGVVDCTSARRLYIDEPRRTDADNAAETDCELAYGARY